MRRRLPWAIWAVVMLMLALTAWLSALSGSWGRDGAFLAVALMMIVGYTTIGALIWSRTEGNPIGWLLMLVGLGFLLGGLTDEYLQLVFVHGWDRTPLADVSGWLTNWVFFLVAAPIPWVLLLFPSGTLPSRRWRPLAITIAVVSAILIVASIVNPGPIDVDPTVERPPLNPTGIPALEDVLPLVFAIGGFGLLGLGFLCVVALVLRYRRSAGEERQQMRWFVAAVTLAAPILIGAIVSSIGLGENETRPLSEIFFLAFFTVVAIGLPGACAVAILRYRLYDLDVVVKKTVVFAVLVALLMAIGGGVALLVGIGVVPSLYDAPPMLLVAGAVLGLLVVPLYRLSTRLADRLVFGGRSTPYQVLTEFSGRVGETYSSEDVLPRMGQLVGEATRARASRVWLRVGRELHEAVTWPREAPGRRILETGSDRLPDLPGEEAFEVRHQGELLGALSVEPAPSDPMTPAKRRIVQDLASQAGFVLRNVRLIEELRASRQRLVAAQDQERRRLERNIHDGAQQQLVALTVKLRLLEQVAEREPAKAAHIAAQLQVETAEALDDLRDLARGIYPPLLADQGLPAALVAQARKSPVPVEVDADGVGRFPQEVEAAVYFSCLEALQNVAKYAGASRIEISVASHDDGHLSFAVLDDGVGFDPSTTTTGTGLQGIADRIDALGGTFVVTSSPGAGTSLNGTVPLT
ncbi:MAG: sensor histidine kinase [Actinomycetota bacterium]